MRKRPRIQGVGKIYFRVFLLSLILPLTVIAEQITPLYSITDFVTCANAKTNPPHDWHVPKSAFLSSDDELFVWVELRNVTGFHPVEIKLYTPFGNFYGEETQWINEPNGPAHWWRMVAWWSIQNENIGQIPGKWRLDLVIEGALQRSISFEIVQDSPALSIFGKDDFNNSTAPAHMNRSPLVNKELDRVWIIQTSQDLVHWSNVQTNEFLEISVSKTILNKENFRLSLSRRDFGNCILEVSTDSVDWTSIQTNEIPFLKTSHHSETNRFYRAFVRPRSILDMDLEE
ncbi:MAG: hypothetical protein LR011_00060 [Verrucomicrobia bacterium]|nr:hypothetical protein [Verrucomicrobiota bacterium]